MTAVAMTRTLAGLSPANDEAAHVLRRVPVGNVVQVELHRPRRNKALRKWWALCNLVHQNCEQFRSPEQVHDFLKIKAGHCTQVVSKATGEIFLIADSIAFARLDEDEFQTVWGRAVQAVCTDILPGVEQAEMEYQILKLIGAAG